MSPSPQIRSKYIGFGEVDWRGFALCTYKLIISWNMILNLTCLLHSLAERSEIYHTKSKQILKSKTRNKMITTITTKTRNKVEPNNFPSLSLFPWYVLMRGNWILLGFPLMFCQVSYSILLWVTPPEFFTLSHGIKSDFSKAFRISRGILSGFPTVFC